VAQGNDRAARKQALLRRVRFITEELPQLVAEALALALPSESPELIAAERALTRWLAELERSHRGE
jgi:hypothetical protein